MDKCHVTPMEKQVTAEEQARLTDARLLIWGMGCPNCAARVRNSLLALQGVVEAVIDHNTGVGRVFYNPGMVTGPDLERTVSAAGGDGRHEYLGRVVAPAS
jgi:copper chaperone CopZ